MERAEGLGLGKGGGGEDKRGQGRCLALEGSLLQAINKFL
jgi:hypothetical protein